MSEMPKYVPPSETEGNGSRESEWNRESLLEQGLLSEEAIDEILALKENFINASPEEREDIRREVDKEFTEVKNAYWNERGRKDEEKEKEFMLHLAKSIMTSPLPPDSLG